MIDDPTRPIQFVRRSSAPHRMQIPCSESHTSVTQGSGGSLRRGSMGCHTNRAALARPTSARRAARGAGPAAAVAPRDDVRSQEAFQPRQIAVASGGDELGEQAPVLVPVGREPGPTHVHRLRGAPLQLAAVLRGPPSVRRCAPPRGCLVATERFRGRSKISQTRRVTRDAHRLTDLRTSRRGGQTRPGRSRCHAPRARCQMPGARCLVPQRVLCRCPAGRRCWSAVVSRAQASRSQAMALPRAPL